MKVLYQDIKTQVDLIKGADDKPVFKHVHIWNNQTQYLDDGQDYSFPSPALFVEFVNTNESASIGGGVQIYDPLYVNFHIVHYELDAMDGTLEQNLTIFDLEAEVFAAFYKWKTTNGSGPFERIGTDRDYDHTNVYHTIQKYATSWIDSSRTEPIGGQEVNPPFTAQITGNF